MEKELLLEKIETDIKSQFLNESTGHDYYHIARVAYMARQIAQAEHADAFVCTLAAWVHDIGDYKLNGGVDKSEELIRNFLSEYSLGTSLIDRIVTIVSQVSFSKGKHAESLEAKIVQDADRLDAIGTIGIARAFAYGGSVGHSIYNPIDPTQNTSVQHFYDKLLKLKELMHTRTAIAIAEKRQQFLLQFLEQFYKEWNMENECLN
ncbi:HD domain-containing protein [Rhizosphaericola mali]|uniref:HD domain-containing protein n=2 Tax=Rhizosphaericola mali TaxID=2545455 RepID=A0A5P2GAN3_9BACT|nr:HD domain-containing protein [Rhizosphaericola mali]